MARVSDRSWYAGESCFGGNTKCQQRLGPVTVVLMNEYNTVTALFFI